MFFPNRGREWKFGGLGDLDNYSIQEGSSIPGWLDLELQGRAGLAVRESRLPLERLEAVLLTHFHSDHIAALPEFNLNSWVLGRPKPLSVIGPAGSEDVKMITP